MYSIYSMKPECLPCTTVQKKTKHTIQLELSIKQPRQCSHSLVFFCFKLRLLWLLVLQCTDVILVLQCTDVILVLQCTDVILVLQCTDVILVLQCTDVILILVYRRYTSITVYRRYTSISVQTLYSERQIFNSRNHYIRWEMIVRLFILVGHRYFNFLSIIRLEMDFILNFITGAPETYSVLSEGTPRSAMFDVQCMCRYA